MSCFIMKPDRIANLAVYIAYVLNQNEFALWPGDGLYQFADCTFPDETCLFDEEKIYEKLYRFNVESYIERYGEDSLPNPEFVPDFRPDRADLPPREWVTIEIERNRRAGHWNITPAHYALLKTFDCYLYQTAEGKCLDSDFRKELKFFRDDLQSFIVFNSPQYINATWG